MNREIIEEYIDSYVMMLNLTNEYYFFSTSMPLADGTICYYIRASKTPKQVYSLLLYSIAYDYDKKLNVAVSAYSDTKCLCRKMENFEEILTITIDAAMKYCDSIYI